MSDLNELIELSRELIHLEKEGKTISVIQEDRVRYLLDVQRSEIIETVVEHLSKMVEEEEALTRRAFCGNWPDDMDLRWFDGYKAAINTIRQLSDTSKMNEHEGSN